MEYTQVANSKTTGTRRSASAKLSIKTSSVAKPFLKAAAVLSLTLGLSLGAPLAAADWRETAYQIGTKAEARLHGLYSERISVDDINMAYYDNRRSDKPAIIMLHGYTADKEVWPRFARHFSKDYRVLIPDLAGHGNTVAKAGLDPMALNYSAPRQAQRVLALMDALGIEKAHIIGNSMGGFISAHFGLRYPERSLSLGLVDAAGVHSPVPSSGEKQVLAGGSNPFLPETMAAFHEFYPLTMAKAPWLPGFFVDAIGQRYLERRDLHAKIFSDFFMKDMLDTELGNISPATLVLWGDKDEIINISAASVWQAGLPKAELSSWPELGHMPMLEDPKAAAKRYQTFLDSL